MQFGSFKLDKAKGLILAHSLKLENLNIRKGTIITQEHINELVKNNINSIVCARLSNNDIEENKAAIIISKSFSHKSLKFSKSKTGRINIFSKYNGLLNYSINSLMKFNLVDEGIALALLSQNSLVKEKQLIGTLKIIPYSLPRKITTQFNVLNQFIKVKPIKEKRFALIQTIFSKTKLSSVNKTLEETKSRVEVLKGNLLNDVICQHSEDELIKKINLLIKKDIDILLISCASAVSDRNDILPKSIVSLGGKILHFGMPVDPGNLLILASLNKKYIIGMPGCARSPSLNGLDLILRMLVVDIKINKDLIASLGAGGLLKDTKFRPMPRNNLK